MRLDVDKLTLALRMLDIGEFKRGYGHASSEEIAEKLLEHFTISLKDADDD